MGQSEWYVGRRLQGCIAMDSVPSASVDTVRIQAGQVGLETKIVPDG